MVVALSRFGTWSGLMETTSSPWDAYPATATFTSATPRSRASTSASSRWSTRPTTTAARARASCSSPSRRRRATCGRSTRQHFGQQTGYPFLDFGNKFFVLGPSYVPDVLAGLNQQEIAAKLSNPKDPVTQRDRRHRQLPHGVDLRHDGEPAGVGVLGIGDAQGGRRHETELTGRRCPTWTLDAGRYEHLPALPRWRPWAAFAAVDDRVRHLDVPDHRALPGRSPDLLVQRRRQLPARSPRASTPTSSASRWRCWGCSSSPPWSAINWPAAVAGPGAVGGGGAPRPGRERDLLRPLPAGAELFSIKAICLWCTGVHVTTFFLFVLVVVSFPLMSPPGPALPGVGRGRHEA